MQHYKTKVKKMNFRELTSEFLENSKRNKHLLVPHLFQFKPSLYLTEDTKKGKHSSLSSLEEIIS